MSKPTPLLIVSAFALVSVAATPQAKEARPACEDWHAWSAFPEGAWVMIERDFRGSKSANTITLIKKAPDRLTVKWSKEKVGDEKKAEDEPEVILEGLPFSDEVVYEKNPKQMLCPTCRANHKASIISEQKKEKLTVGGKEIVCYVMDVVPFDCRGAKSGMSRWWLSKEVPGGLVKREWTAIDRPGRVIDTVVGFDKQKKVSSEGK
jgi:hypothetical protein